MNASNTNDNLIKNEFKSESGGVSARYFVLPGKVIIEGEEHDTYGIGIINEDVMTACVQDVSPDFNKVKRMVSLFNIHKLSKIHIYEAIEDFIT